MSKFLIAFIIGYLTLIATPSLSAFSGDIDTPVQDKKIETIKELRENITELEQEKKELKQNWENFLTENGAIQDLLKDDIAEEDEEKLKEILSLYNNYTSRVDEQLGETTSKEESDSLKQELMSLKQDLYKKLVYFIKVERLDDFLTYVKWDLEVNEKRKDVTEEIDEDKKKLETKVNTIREKIEENKNVLEERIRHSISEKLDIKIAEILANERFIKLETEAKKNLFQITIEKAEVKQQELEAILNKTTIINQKIEVYNIMKQKLTEAMQTFE